MIKPFNDHLLIELQKSEWATADEQGEQDDPRAGSGIVVDVPENVYYFSSYTWIGDQNIDFSENWEPLQKVMKSLKGKRVYFEKRADIGNTIEDGDKKYATIKLSKITGVEE